MALLAAAVLPWLNRDNIIVRGAAIAVLHRAVTWRYLYWRLCETLPPAGLTWISQPVPMSMTVEGASTILGATASLIFSNARAP